MTHLGHGSALHLHRQSRRQSLLQALTLQACRHEPVAADDQALVHLGKTCFHPHFGQVRRIQHPLRQGRFCRPCQLCRQHGVGGKVRSTVEGHFIDGEERRRVHIVLHKRAGHHHVPNLRERRHAAGNAGEQHLAHIKAFDQHRGGGGCGHLANAREHRHHVVSMPATQHKLTPGHGVLLLLRQPGQHGSQLGVHGADDGDSRHGNSIKKIAAEAARVWRGQAS